MNERSLEERIEALEKRLERAISALSGGQRLEDLEEWARRRMAVASTEDRIRPGPIPGSLIF